MAGRKSGNQQKRKTNLNMLKNPYQGRFVVFEGLDGAGTTTQLDLLAKYLKKKKIKTHFTREPTEYLIGGLIKSWLSHDWQSTPECLQLLFTADRAYHLAKEIIPLLKKGVMVISDRYLFSTLAYGMSEIKDKDWLFEINRKFILPDITFFLDVSPKICLERIKKDRFSLELFEKEEKLKKVRENYLEIFKKFKNIYIINSERSIEEVFSAIKKLISPHL